MAFLAASLSTLLVATAAASKATPWSSLLERKIVQWDTWAYTSRCLDVNRTFFDQHQWAPVYLKPCSGNDDNQDFYRDGDGMIHWQSNPSWCVGPDERRGGDEFLILGLCKGMAGAFAKWQITCTFSHSDLPPRCQYRYNPTPYGCIVASVKSGDAYSLRLGKCGEDFFTPPWTKYQGKNCYSGHGAHEVDQVPVGKMTLADCEAQCDQNSPHASEMETCRGVTIAWSKDGLEPTDCWRRSNIDIQHCESGDGYDTWLTPQAEHTVNCTNCVQTQDVVIV